MRARASRTASRSEAWTSRSSEAKPRHSCRLWLVPLLSFGMLFATPFEFWLPLVQRNSSLKSSLTDCPCGHFTIQFQGCAFLSRCEFSNSSLLTAGRPPVHIFVFCCSFTRPRIAFPVPEKPCLPIVLRASTPSASLPFPLPPAASPSVQSPSTVSASQGSSDPDSSYCD